MFEKATSNLKTFNVYLLADAGHCYDEIGDEKNAQRFINLALGEDANYALTYHYIGLYYLKRGERDAATGAFLTAVKLDPLWSPSRNFLK